MQKAVPAPVRRTCMQGRHRHQQAWPCRTYRGCRSRGRHKRAGVRDVAAEGEREQRSAGERAKRAQRGHGSREHLSDGHPRQHRQEHDLHATAARVAPC